MQLSDVIAESAVAALCLQRPDGAFPPGRNGPYRDEETPLRNTAHWLGTLRYAHAVSGTSGFLDAAARAARYLTTASLRPHGATFLCRLSRSKDSCNGLIGQAWAIEGLLAAAEALGEPRYRELAVGLFDLHPFDSDLGLWRIVDVDGQPGRIDPTFNHQLWFAAAGALLDPTPAGAIGRRVHRFLDKSPRHLRVGSFGRIRHYVQDLPRPPQARRPLRSGFGIPAPVWRALRRGRAHGRTLWRWPAGVQREIGYHAFNLYGFAMIRQRVPTHPLWNSAKLRTALAFVGRGAFHLGLERNPYGYPYNAPGFEVAFALQVFGELDGFGAPPDHWWVTRQLGRAYNWTERLMARGTDDPATLAARLYEACRLRDVSIPLAARVGPAGRPGSRGVAALP